MIELKDFISESLKQIVTGISDAQDFVIEKGGNVSPKNIIFDGRNNASSGGFVNQPYLVNMIEYDIAIVVQDSTEGQGGAGIFVGGISIGGRVKADQTTTNESRIKFSIPVIYPTKEHLLE